MNAQDSISYKSSHNRQSSFEHGKAVPLQTLKSDAKCHEQGIVVVTVAVNREGDVVEVSAPARGSTTSAICLVEQAKAFALKTKFNANPNAPEKQYGTVKYDFKLKE